MTNGWQEVTLREVAKPISRPIPVQVGTEYRTIGVKWWGMGAYERETIDGSRTAAKTLSIVREGDLIINKIWVRHGSVAIAGKNVDGCAGSGEFPTFELDLNRIDPRWIHWQTKMKSFWKKCDNLSRGTSGKNRIKPELFLTINIPLPSVTEQHRILAHVESLAAQVNEAQRLREEAEIEASVVIVSALRKIFIEPEPRALLGEVIQLQRGFDLPRQNRVEGKYPIFAANGEVARHNEFRVKGPGVLTGRSGSVGSANYVKEDYWPLNTSLYVKDFKGNEPKLVYYLIRAISRELKDVSSHTAVPTLDRKKAHSKILVHVPPFKEQRQIIDYLDALHAKVDALRGLQYETEQELNALMPSVLDKAFKGEL